MDHEPELHGDRPYTIRATFISLAIGLAIATVVALILVSLRQPPTLGDKGVQWSAGAFMVPLAGLLSVGILAWSVFFLPIALARRQGMVLDPNIWPATGVVALTVIVIVGFIGAIMIGIL
jgi:hypothetical protein